MEHQAAAQAPNPAAAAMSHPMPPPPPPGAMPSMPMGAVPPPPAPHPPAHQPAPSAAAMRSPKRVRLNAAQKEAVLALLAGGARIDYVVETFGIAKRTVFKIQRAQRLKEAEELQKRADEANAEVAGKAAPLQMPPAVAAAAVAAGQLAPPGAMDPALMAAAAASAAMQIAPNVGAPSADVGAPATATVAAAMVPSAAMQMDANALAAPSGADTPTTLGKNPGPKKASPPAKRVRLNVSEKLDICNFVQAGGTPAEVIDKYGISRRTFFKILHDEQDIRQTVNRDHVSAETKSIRPPHFPLLDQALSAFVLSARAARIPLNWHMVREQALRIRHDLLESGNERPERVPLLERFTASEHWCQLFVRKNANKKLPAALDEPVQPARRQAVKETKHLQGQLGSFGADNIYTLVTPRIYYRNVPPSFFLNGPVKMENVPPPPLNGANEPFLTLIVAANLTGTKRLPIAMIPPPHMQKVFESRRPSLPCFFSNEKQVCDSVMLMQWLREIFVPFVSANNGSKVALMMDEDHAVSASGSFGLHVDQVAYVLVPRLSICMTETARHGIFPLLVARYRYKLFETFSALVPMQKELRKAGEELAVHHRGLAEGCYATIYDAADILRDAWPDVPSDRIARCWWRLNVLPESVVAQLDGMYGATTDIQTVTEISNLVLNIVRTNPRGHEGLNSIAYGKARYISVIEVIRWFCLEYEMLPKHEPGTPRIGPSGAIEQNGRPGELDWNVVVPPDSAQLPVGEPETGPTVPALPDTVPITSAGPAVSVGQPVAVVQPASVGQAVSAGQPIGHNQIAQQNVGVGQQMPIGQQVGVSQPMTVGGPSVNVGPPMAVAEQVPVSQALPQPVTVGVEPLVQVPMGHQQHQHQQVAPLGAMPQEQDPVGVGVGATFKDEMDENGFVEMEVPDGLMRKKYTHRQFTTVMKHYADLEKCIVETQDTEALRNLRLAKKSSLNYFVVNGAADAADTLPVGPVGAAAPGAT